VTRIDLHPEALIDAERDGTLDPRGATRLAAHRASCAACATEHALVGAFARIATPSDDDRAIAARVVAQMFERELPLAVSGVDVANATAANATHAATAARTAHSPEALHAATMRRRVALFAMVAVLALAASVAAWRALTPTREHASSHDLASTRGGDAAGRAPAQITPPASAEPVAPALIADAPVRAQDVRASSPATAARNANANVLSGADAAALFSAANLARRGGRHREAVALYRALAQRFPGSREEVVARVTFGYLLLDRMARPREALPLFESYLAIEHDGAMDEEARVGLARALGRLGRAAEERRALEGLLARHPDGVHAATVRARLEVLDR